MGRLTREPIRYDEKNYSANFKAKIKFEAIQVILALSELSKNYNMHPNMLSTWKQTVIETFHAKIR